MYFETKIVYKIPTNTENKIEPLSYNIFSIHNLYYVSIMFYFFSPFAYIQLKILNIKMIFNQVY